MTTGIELAQTGLSLGMALFSRFAIPDRRQLIILGDTLCIFEHPPEVELGIDITLVGQRLDGHIGRVVIRP